MAGSTLRDPRDQRGQVLSSLLAVVSVVVLLGAAVGLLTGAGSNASDQPGGVVTTTPGDRSTADREPKQRKRPDTPHQRPTKGPQKPDRPTKSPPSVVRDVYVEVYNTTSITGLAAETADRLEDAGWDVVVTANWYDEVPQSTVYYGTDLRTTAERLARTLDIDRVRPAESPMRSQRVTAILAADYSG